MKRIVLTFCATALLIAPCYSQAQIQGRDDMSVTEFRQLLVDLGTYLDSHKNTNLRQQLEAVPDDTLRALYPAFAHPRQLQTSVTALKQHDLNVAAGGQSHAHIAAAAPLAVFPACSANAIIDTAPGAACTPAYPDPANGSWRSLVDPLIAFGAFSSQDYSSVSSQSCSLTVESNLSLVSSALQGTVLAASSICGALPSLAGNACWVANAAFSIASAVSFGLFSDCQEQDGNVNSAEIDAAFHNTVTIFNALSNATGRIDTINNNLTALDGKTTTIGTTVNTIGGNVTALITGISNVQTSINVLQGSVNTLATSVAGNQALNFQLAIEQELLQAGRGGIGLFELPAASGGYLEKTRQVVVETIARFRAAGQSVGSADSSLSLADDAVSRKDYKAAFTYYRDAYRLAVQ